MAIYNRLQNTLLAETGHLLAAYELTLHGISLVDRNDPLTAMIADKIVQIGATRPQRSHRDIEADREVSLVQLGRSRWLKQHPSPG